MQILVHGASWAAWPRLGNAPVVPGNILAVVYGLSGVTGFCLPYLTPDRMPHLILGKRADRVTEG